MGIGNLREYGAWKTEKKGETEEGMTIWGETKELPKTEEREEEIKESENCDCKCTCGKH